MEAMRRLFLSAHGKLIHSLCNQVYRPELIHFHSEEESAVSAETALCFVLVFFSVCAVDAEPMVRFLFHVVLFFVFSFFFPQLGILHHTRCDVS